jgi:hypothetical protein
MLALPACSSDSESPGGAGASGGANTGGAASGGSTATGGSGSGSGGAGTGGAGASSTGGAASGGSAGAATGGSGGSGGSAGSTGGSAGAGGSGGSVGPGPSGLPVPPGPADVPKPSGTPGEITVLDWAGFKAAVSYSFDDANPSQISNYDAMNALGVPFTYYLYTSKAEAGNAVWQQAVDDGHEVGNHTKSHKYANEVNVATDVNDATAFIEDNFMATPYTFAAPYGDTGYGTGVSALFFINRGVSFSVIKTSTAASAAGNLPAWIPQSSVTATAGGTNGEPSFNARLDTTRNEGGWEVICIHGFDSQQGTYQPVDFNGFVTHVNYAKGLGDVWIGTVRDVGAYWLGQKSFDAATTMTQGSDTTYTWTLPAHFPPGHYLRVKVDGGTLTQGGAPLTWDPHGYYEIELDKKTVTVSP